ncbi:MAG TPA: hypothetical protein VHO03_15790 [Ignavibacteriales bacterium]|nr:hypothetical protein [Ignavibacteriales bacterium]
MEITKYNKGNEKKKRFRSNGARKWFLAPHFGLELVPGSPPGEWE